MESSRTFNPETAYDGMAPLFDPTLRDATEVSAHADWLLRTLRALDARTVVDAAAGTGAQTLALCAGGGFEVVVAADASAEMLRICRGKLDALGIRYGESWPAVSPAPGGIIVMRCTWAELRSRLPHRAWDAILCLGFSLQHLCTTERFLDVLDGWRELLRLDGHLLLDFGTNHSASAERVRAGTFHPEPRTWATVEERDRSGTVHVVTTGREFLEDPATPLGWKIRVQKVIARLSDDRAVSDARTMAYETALLDERSIDALTRDAGFRAIELPCGPSPRLHVNVRDLLLAQRR
jgi:SAM-dependent methyltransferase